MTRIAAALAITSLGLLSLDAAAQRLDPAPNPAQIPHTQSGLVVRGVADFDGDGTVDILSEDAANDALMLAVGDGTGLFAPPSPLVVPASFADNEAPEFHDVDGDGDLDMFFLVPAGLQLAFNDLAAGGGFRQAPIPAIAAADFVFGDADGDGDVDVLAPRGPTTVTVVVWRNDGTGRFSTTNSSPNSGAIVWTTHLADLDGDGDLDLIANGSLYHNDGVGNFTRRVGQNVPIGDYAVADFDGDGRPDIAQAGLVWVLFGNASGGYTLRQLSDLIPSNVRPTAVDAYDVDGDADVDLVFSGVTTWRSAILINDGTGGFAAGPTLSGHGLRSVDVDGDGDADLVGNREHDQVLYLAAAAGQLVDATPPTVDAGAWFTAAVGDVDGDGDRDIVLPGRLGVDTYLNDGASGFRVLTAAVFRSTAPIRLADLDGDGNLDVVQGVEVFAGDGRGGFALRTSVTNTNPLSGLEAFDLADLDGDGDPDLVYATSVWRNDGGFSFTENTPPQMGGSGSVATAFDADGDGDLDLFKAPTNELFLNTGAGQFVLGGGIPTLPRSVWCDDADIDLDGDRDLILSVAPSVGVNELRLLVNDGAGTFTDQTTALLGSVPTARNAAVADFDLDGDLDLFATHAFGELLYERTPQGFVERTSQWLGAAALRGGTQLTVADLDDDGDPDILRIGLGGEPQIVHAQRRQLRSAQHARTGSRLRLVATVQSGMGEQVVPVLAARQLSPKVATPWGDLGVDLGTAAVLGSRPVPPFGTSAWDVLVPNVPALVGGDVFAQALFVGGAAPSRLSNVVRIRAIE